MNAGGGEWTFFPPNSYPIIVCLFLYFSFTGFLCWQSFGCFPFLFENFAPADLMASPSAVIILR